MSSIVMIYWVDHFVTNEKMQRDPPRFFACRVVLLIDEEGYCCVCHVPAHVTLVAEKTS
jgi:hypothetical protein